MRIRKLTSRYNIYLLALIAFHGSVNAADSRDLAQSNSSLEIEKIGGLPVHGYDPKDAEIPFVLEELSKLELLRNEKRDRDDVSERCVELLDKYDKLSLPTIARERLLYETIQLIGEYGSLSDLPVLKKYQERKPEAVFMVPGCKSPEYVYYYDYSNRSLQAEDLIHYRSAFNQMEDKLSTELTFHDFSSLIDAARSPWELRGLLDSWSTGGKGDKDKRFLELLKSSRFTKSDDSSWREYEILRIAERIHSIESVEEIILTASIPSAQKAVVSWHKMRSSHDAIKVFRLIKSRPELASILLGGLNHSDSTNELNIGLLDLVENEQHGSAAAISLCRVDPEYAVQYAIQTLDKPDANLIQKQRAILILMKIDSDISREALSRFTNVSMTSSTAFERNLVGKVQAWLVRK